MVVAGLQTVISSQSRPDEPGYVVPLAVIVVAALTIGNVVVSYRVDRVTEAERLRVIGLLAFALDVTAITALVWIYSTHPQDSTWVAAFVLPLEGAVRYGLPGAIPPVAVTLVSQGLREEWFASRFPGYDANFRAVAFRISVEAVVAVVAGVMARSLEREADLARERALAAEETARLAETAARRLRELDDMKSDFVAITSHELRTPLAAIHGFVDTLGRRMDELTTDEVREFLAIVRAQTNRLTRLVEDLLVVSRIDAGRLAFHPEPIALQPFLGNVLQGLGESSVRVDLQPAPTLPEEMVADPQRLTQVLTNLLENALKFSSSPSRVSLEAAGTAGAITFTVRDRGPGIPPDELGRIFDRFHQTDAASTRPAEGAGLGLYITKQLVEAMGGRIDVESRVADGSSFRVTLPIHSDPTAPARRSGATRAG